MMNVQCRVIVGGNLMSFLIRSLMAKEGTPKLKESIKQVENICLTHDLVDIWRVRNPSLKRLT